MNRRWVLGLAALVAVGVSPARTSAGVHVAEVRGDFYYDADGHLLGMRNVDPPADLVRKPMSAREKFQMLGIQLPTSVRSLEPRWVPAKPSRVDDRQGLSRDKIIVKFVEGMKVRLRNGRLLADGAAIPSVDAILAKYPDAKVQRAFDVEERILDSDKETGQLIGGKELADLNNFYLITFPTPSEKGVALANELLALNEVETAYLQAHGEAPACGDIAPATPLWRANQFYLDPAPNGVDAVYSWAYHPGGNGAGAGFYVCDCEWAWCFGHEDINIAVTDVLNGSVNNTGPEHGTAVLGEIGACDNGYGMTGISSDVSLKMCDFDNAATWAAAITFADGVLFPGEVMLLEIHILGPSSGLTCTCNCGQFEYVPVEWDVASWNAIQTATANGTVVVEAGGNGSMNLDAAQYSGWFNPGHDSGAIIVGAGTSGGHAPECWTDYGSRVNVHGYGDTVYSTGYGDLWNQASCEQDYTASFSGTSSASPIITGVCADLQGIANQKYGYDISPSLMRAAIQVGGTPQGAPTTHHIGPMPNMVNAINAIEPDMVATFTPGGWSYPIVPRTTADSNGGYAPLAAAALPGNVAATYWNWTEWNQSVYSPTLNSPRALVAVDDGWLWQCFNSNFGANTWQWCGNTGGPDNIKGGRHTVMDRADYLDAEAESNEGNNDWTRQFIWSPYVLSVNTPVTRSYDPPKTSTGYGPYYNAEGFQGTTGSQYWHAFAILPTQASDDFDIYLHNETPMNIPQQGFGASVASSGFLNGQIDFVILDRNTIPGGTYYASGIDWAGTGNKVVEYDQDHGIVANPGTNGPYTLAAGNLIELHEIYIASGVQTRIQVHWLSGGADYGLSVHRDPSGFSSKGDYISGGYANNVGPGQDEYVIVSPAAGNWHGIAVWKAQTADLGQSLTYQLIVSQSPNLTASTPSGWYGPVVPRNTTDATLVSAPLPATLNGNQTTTSYNFSTYNEGPNNAVSPWQTRLYVDDTWYWYGNAGTIGPGTFQQWINTQQGLDPYSLVRGGRHHIRLDADALNQVTEMFETDNTFVDWFVWTPYDLVNQTPVIRNAPPLKDPVGYTEYSVDGFRAAPAGSYWTGVGVLPSSATGDYDVRLHTASTGSKDGFGSWLEWSGDATDGACDFAVVNYNAAASAAYDYGILNWNADGSTCSVQRADAPYWGSMPPGVTRLGPFTLGANEVFDLHEVFLGTGTPVYIGVNNLSGNANLGISAFDGTIPYHVKYSGYLANANGDGADEHLTAIVPAGQFWGIAVWKSASGDLPKTATYEIVISVGSNPVDAPVIEAPPAKFALAAPVPNPFRSQSEIRFDVPVNGGRSLVAVYDLQGRRIATLAQGEQAAGRHSLSWDGRDSSGRQVAAGVYFVRLESSAVTETRKVTLLR